MSIVEFVRGFAPVQERKDLLNRTVELEKEIQESLIPLIQDFNEVFEGIEFKSKFAKDFDTAFNYVVQGQRQSGTTLVLQSPRAILDNLLVVETEIKRLFSPTFTPAKITYNRIQVIQYLMALSWYTRYLRKFIIKLLAEESALTGNASKLDWTRAQTEWLNDNRRAFIKMYQYATMRPANLKAIFNETSSAEFDEATFEVAQKQLGPNIDPMNISGFMGNPLNITLAAGKSYIEFRYWLANERKEEVENLQLRLQEAREIQQNDGSSPALQKIIKVTEERIAKLTYRINSFEEQYLAEV